MKFSVNKKILNIVVLVSLVLIFNNIVIAEIYYVSLKGSDQNSGSFSFPWLTIMHAVEKSKPGDTVLLREGTYNENIWIRSLYGQGGANGQFWTLEAYPGEEVIFRLPAPLKIDANYVRVKGLHFIGNQGLNVVRWGYGDHHHIEIINNKFDMETYDHAVIGFSADYVLVERNVIRVTGRSNVGTQGQGIYPAYGSHYVIRKNYVNGATGFGIHVYDERKQVGDPIRLISDVLIESNFIENSKERAGIVVTTGHSCEAKDIIIRNNICKNNALYGIRVGVTLGRNSDGYGDNLAGPTENAKVYNNVLYQNGRAGINVGGRPDRKVRNVDIKNNIICNTRPYSGFQYQVEIWDAENVDLANNLYWPESIGFKDITDRNPIYANPLFVNPENNDFHIQSSSKAIDSGLDVDVYNDFDGKSRPQGFGFDIGAFEYGISAKSHLDVTPVEVSNFASAKVGEPFNMKVIIKNVGIDSISGAVGWKGTITDTNGIIVGLPRGTKAINLIPPEVSASIETIDDTQWIPERSGKYLIHIQLAYNGDENAKNDTLTANLFLSETSEIELNFLEATVKDNAVQLVWQCASNSDFLGFEIERSSDGMHFQKIGFLDRHKVNNYNGYYKYIDNTIQSTKYYYRVNKIYSYGSSEYSSIIEIYIPIAEQFFLQQNYPNPFNPSTSICYTLPCKADVDLVIFNKIGQILKTLVKETQLAGQKIVTWDGKDENGADVASGIYLYKLNIDESSIARKMILIR